MDKQLKVELISDHARDFDQCYFEVKATDVRGTEVTLRYEWEDQKMSVTISPDASLIANTFDLDIIARVTKAIVDAFTEDHEMFPDVFYDADGSSTVVLNA